jgi:hypothetical protein
MRVVARQCSRLDRAAVVLHYPEMLIVAGYLRVSPDLRDRYLEHPDRIVIYAEVLRYEIESVGPA